MWVRDMKTGTHSMEQCSDPSWYFALQVGFVREDLLKLLLVLSLMNSALNPVLVWCDFITVYFPLLSMKTQMPAPYVSSWSLVRKVFSSCIYGICRNRGSSCASFGFLLSFAHVSHQFVPAGSCSCYPKSLNFCGAEIYVYVYKSVAEIGDFFFFFLLMWFREGQGVNDIVSGRVHFCLQQGRKPCPAGESCAWAVWNSAVSSGCL